MRDKSSGPVSEMVARPSRLRQRYQQATDRYGFHASPIRRIRSGVGAFPPLYPAFRRPAIFHIEGKHNTETDHAEDEYLEQFLPDERVPQLIAEGVVTEDTTVRDYHAAAASPVR